VSDIFQEVDEELRHDQWLRLWRRYRYLILGLAALIVIATGATVGWRQYQQQQRQAEGMRYAAALDLARAGRPAEAADALTAFASDAHSGRALLARFEAASLRARAGDEAGAIADYDALSKDPSIDPIYRDLAAVLWALHALDTVDSQTIVERLAPLTGPDNPWHPSAIEVTAVAHLKAGDRAAARTDYQKLSDDLSAPPSMRARATEMISALTS
jgi:hypothetical protein